jgi:hypothetical protein
MTISKSISTYMARIDMETYVFEKGEPGHLEDFMEKLADLSSPYVEAKTTDGHSCLIPKAKLRDAILIEKVWRNTPFESTG